MNNNYLIDFHNITKIYKTGQHEIRALDNINLKIKKKDFLAFLGPSGSGKSTCLYIMGCLAKPTSGLYKLDNINISKECDENLAKIRNKKIGFVFQMFNLLHRATALENVELPLLYAGVKDRKEKAKAVLDMVGLGNRIYSKSNEFSGGEMQRIAIARAIINDPDIILADEPTGNLDTKTSSDIIKIFGQLSSMGKTIIIVTHNIDIAKKAHRIINFRDGRIVS